MRLAGPGPCRTGKPGCTPLQANGEGSAQQRGGGRCVQAENVYHVILRPSRRYNGEAIRDGRRCRRPSFSTSSCAHLPSRSRFDSERQVVVSRHPKLGERPALTRAETPTNSANKVTVKRGWRWRAGMAPKRENYRETRKVPQRAVLVVCSHDGPNKSSMSLQRQNHTCPRGYRYRPPHWGATQLLSVYARSNNTTALAQRRRVREIKTS